ncbi:hypothetical protein FN846DRAFT_915466 [Sphaerosporella brunnea]|uniref:Uncharacterized protein n=1 Tax=Sphaerosporella brunnea TaxID=1250544 RepID=A0A5J5FBK0_9PEZI|nr:hypothetical protein FN846DRAFT_915466 [Sphaerosporella brunnea]
MARLDRLPTETLIDIFKSITDFNESALSLGCCSRRLYSVYCTYKPEILLTQMFFHKSFEYHLPFEGRTVIYGASSVKMMLDKADRAQKSGQVEKKDGLMAVRMVIAIATISMEEAVTHDAERAKIAQKLEEVRKQAAATLEEACQNIHRRRDILERKLNIGRDGKLKRITAKLLAECCKIAVNQRRARERAMRIWQRSRSGSFWYEATIRGINSDTKYAMAVRVTNAKYSGIALATDLSYSIWKSSFRADIALRNTEGDIRFAVMQAEQEARRDTHNIELQSFIRRIDRELLLLQSIENDYRITACKVAENSSEALWAKFTRLLQLTA